MMTRKTHHVTTQLFTSQKHRRPSHILRLAQSPQRYPSLHIRPFVLVPEILIIELRANRPRKQRITANPMLTQCNCARLHEGQHAGFGGRVVRLLAAADESRDGGYADYGAAGG